MGLKRIKGISSDPFVNLLVIWATIFAIPANARDVYLFQNGKPDIKYEKLVNDLQPGDVLHFSNGRKFVLGEKLGQGQPTVVFEIAGEPDRVLRIPSDGSGLKLGINHYNLSHSQKAIQMMGFWPMGQLELSEAEIRVPKIYESWTGLPEDVHDEPWFQKYISLHHWDPETFANSGRLSEFIVVEKINKKFDLTEFLDYGHTMDKAIFAKARLALVKFAASTFMYEGINDFHGGQLVFDGTEWVLLDFHCNGVLLRDGWWVGAGNERRFRHWDVKDLDDPYLQLKGVYHSKTGAQTTIVDLESYKMRNVFSGIDFGEVSTMDDFGGTYDRRLDRFRENSEWKRSLMIEIFEEIKYQRLLHYRLVKKLYLDPGQTRGQIIDYVSRVNPGDSVLLSNGNVVTVGAPPTLRGNQIRVTDSNGKLITGTIVKTAPTTFLDTIKKGISFFRGTSVTCGELFTTSFFESFVPMPH